MAPYAPLLLLLPTAGSPAPAAPRVLAVAAAASLRPALEALRPGFEAAHRIPGHRGKCAVLHGHSYRVEAEFAGEELDALGMVADFADLRAALTEVLPDHTCLNDVLPCPTTAEGISRWIFEQLRERGLPVSAVTVWETERSGCRYTADAR